MPAEVRLRFTYRGPSGPTAGELAALLDDVEAAYRVAFWTNRVGRFRVAEEEFLGDYRAAGLRQDYVSADPGAWIPLPPPPTRAELELHVRTLTLRSPFEFIGVIEGLASVGLGGIVWFFARNLEDLFDMPDRIRLRRIVRERQQYEEALRRDEARNRYIEARKQRRQRFLLEEGEAVDTPNGGDN